MFITAKNSILFLMMTGCLSLGACRTDSHIIMAEDHSFLEDLTSSFGALDAETASEIDVKITSPSLGWVMNSEAPSLDVHFTVSGADPHAILKLVINGCPEEPIDMENIVGSGCESTEDDITCSRRIQIFPNSLMMPPPCYREWEHQSRSVWQLFRPIQVDISRADEGMKPSRLYRDRITYYDLSRYNLDVRTPEFSSPGRMIHELAYHLSPEGIQELVPALNDQIPDPAVGTLEDSDALDMRPVRGGPYCIPWDDAPARLKTLTREEKISLKGWVHAEYAAIASVGGPAAMFWAEPEDEDFEFCVRSLDGLIKELGMQEEMPMSIDPVAGGRLQISELLAEVAGTLDVELNLFVRFNNGRPWQRRYLDTDDVSCDIPLDGSVSQVQSEIEVPESDETENRWVSFSVRADMGDHRKQLEILQQEEMAIEPNEFTFNRGGTYCDLGFLAEPMERVEQRAEQAIAQAVADFFNQGIPGVTQLSSAFEATLSTFNLSYALPESKRIELTAHHFDPNIQAENDDPDAPQGMTFHLATSVQSLEPVTALVVDEWLHVAATRAEFATRTPDELSIPFDLSASISTGVLNQVLRALATTDLFSSEWQPTYEDLGLCIPERKASCEIDESGHCYCTRGTSMSGPAKLNGKLLSRLIPELTEVGKRELSIHAQPTLAPTVTMTNNSSEAEPYAMMNLGQYMVSFIDTEGTEWMTLLVDLFDRTFDMRVGNIDDLQSSRLSNRSVDITVLEHRLSRQPADIAVRDALAPLMASHLIRRIHSAIKELPAPEFAHLPRSDKAPYLLTRVADNQHHANYVNVFMNITPKSVLAIK
ncbi:MAG: hypothetical protein QGI45_13510 [Myxococcota bacterium]|nr:hypothetical protein [Myxococcota bacterium]